MKYILLAVLVLTTSAASLGAQTPVFPTGPRYTLSVYGGYMQFDNLFRPTNGASYHNDNGAHVGVQAGIGLNRVVALLGNLAYARTSSELSIPDAVQTSASQDVGVWLLDGNVQLRIPWAYTITPFVQVGVGAARYELHVNDANHSHTDVAFNAALGADVPLFGNVELVAMAKDYIISFDWAEVGDPRFDDHLTGNTSTNIGVSLGLEVGF